MQRTAEAAADFRHSMDKMRSIISALVFIATLITGCCSPHVDLAQENWVILSPAHSHALWTPTAHQIIEAEQCVRHFLRDKDSQKSLTDHQRKQIIRITDNYQNYRIQFVGISKGKNKRIFCNFIPAPDDLIGDSFPDWKSRYIMVMDGGTHFWHIEYDIKSKYCTEFSCNFGM